MTKVICIGGNPASLSAASRIKRNKPDWEIMIYEKSEYISYGACGIPYYIGGEVKKLEDLITLTVEDLTVKRKIPLKINHEVINVDFANKTVKVKPKDTGEIFEDKYDYLFIGTGAHAYIPESFSIFKNGQTNHPRLALVHNLSQGQKIKDFLESKKGEKLSIVILGGGFIGQEMLEAYKKREAPTDIILIDRSALVLQSKSEEFIINKLKEEGITFKKCGIKDAKILSDDKIEVQCADGEVIVADYLQISLGIRPNTQFLKNTNLELADNGAIKIDNYCATNIENVYAAGDCATVCHRILNKNIYYPLAPIANRLGRLAGDCISGKVTPTKFDTLPGALGGIFKNTLKIQKAGGFPGILGTIIWKVFDLHCAKTGITATQAKEMGYTDVDEVLITNNEIAHYYPSPNPNNRKMSILLCFDKKSHLLLGAEITAPTPMGAKKIDTLATALSANMKIEDIQQLDLAYAPPFSPVWDPILICANICEKKLL